MKPFIGIKKIWYGPVITAPLTVETLKTWLKTATEVKNSHQDTWGYTEDDGTVENYINELTGNIYYRDITAKGIKTIAFTLGEYSFEDKVALQGGSLVEEGAGWAAPENPELIYKGVVAMTKTGNYIIYTNGGIVGKTNFVSKNLGLGVSAVAMDNPNDGVSEEYWFDGEKVEAVTPAMRSSKATL